MTIPKNVGYWVACGATAVAGFVTAGLDFVRTKRNKVTEKVKQNYYEVLTEERIPPALNDEKHEKIIEDLIEFEKAEKKK